MGVCYFMHHSLGLSPFPRPAPLKGGDSKAPDQVNHCKRRASSSQMKFPAPGNYRRDRPPGRLPGKIAGPGNRWPGRIPAKGAALAPLGRRLGAAGERRRVGGKLLMRRKISAASLKRSGHSSCQQSAVSCQLPVAGSQWTAGPAVLMGRGPPPKSCHHPPAPTPLMGGGKAPQGPLNLRPTGGEGKAKAMAGIKVALPGQGGSAPGGRRGGGTPGCSPGRRGGNVDRRRS